MTEYAFLIILLPLLSFLTIVFALRWKEMVSALFAVGMIVSSFIISVIVLIETFGRHGDYYTAAFSIVELGTFKLQLGMVIDPLTAMMLVVVTAIGSCVMIYSIGYMQMTPASAGSLPIFPCSFSRCLAWLSLTTSL